MAKRVEAAKRVPPNAHLVWVKIFIQRDLNEDLL